MLHRGGKQRGRLSTLGVALSTSAVVWLSACSSSDEDQSSSDSTVEGATGGSPFTAASGGGTTTGGTVGAVTGGTGGTPGVAAAPSLIARTWRLSHQQYKTSVMDLIGVEPDLQNFTPENGNGKFSNFSSTALVQVELAANYYNTAKTLAWQLTTEQLAALTSCDLTSDCQEAFIDELGARAFRSPVPAEVRTRLSALFDLAATEADAEAEAGYRAVLTAILNSPLFLYRKEIGPAEDTTSQDFALLDHQIAEFLSYSLLDAPPPEWLRDQVASSGLNGDSIGTTLDRLLQEPAFDAQLTRFLSEWLELSHFETVEKSEVYPGFEEVKSLLKDELLAFLTQSGQAEDGLTSLLLDPVPSVSPELDTFYYSDPSAPELGQRLGVLGLGTVLASHAKSYLTSPTLRGTFVRARFFCQEITLPEGFTPPPLSDTEVLGVAKSTRELYERHQASVACATCHDQMDGIGFALEAFDGVGRFRTLDTTQGFSEPINTTAELTDSDVDRTLTSAGDLSQALSESATVRQCFTRQAFRFFFGQMEESLDLPAIVRGDEQFVASDSLRSLTQGLFSTSNTFNRQRGADL